MSATTQFSSDVPSTAPYHPSDSHGSIPRSVPGHDAARRSGQYPQHQPHGHFNHDNSHQHRPNGSIPGGVPGMNHVNQQHRQSQQQSSRPMNHHPGGGMPSTSAPMPPQLQRPKQYGSSNNRNYRQQQQPPNPAMNRYPDYQQQPHQQLPPQPLIPGLPGPIRNDHRNHVVSQPPYARTSQQPHHEPPPQSHSRSQQPPVAAPSSSVAPLPRHPPSVPPLNPEKRAARNLNMAVFKNAIEVGSLVPNDAFELMRVEDIYYSRIIKIGQGTFGEVFKAKCVKTGTIVALKKILMENEKEGFPITALREINMLKSLRHPNVTELVDICSSGSKEKGKTVFFLVFAFCDHDLAGILAKNNLIISAVDAKTMLKQMFEGLNYIHGCEVLHRDMKTANILVSKDGYLKLADFGLARPKIRNAPCYTNRVVTMWYRPPELLLGERSYAGEIDVWGAGCIMAEFWTRTPIFQGHTEQHQLQLICNMCGSINESTMAKARQYPVFRDIDPNFLRGSREVTAKLKKLIKIDSAVDLIERIFTLEPSMRPTAHDALRHKYFNEEPLPKENFADFMRSAAFSGSLFEYTSKSGAHRKPAQQRPTRPPPQVPRTQMVDRIF